jgi:hypothetical protein
MTSDEASETRRREPGVFVPISGRSVPEPGTEHPENGEDTRSCVGEGGLEPPRGFPHWHLKPARLPFRHSPE